MLTEADAAVRRARYILVATALLYVLLFAVQLKLSIGWAVWRTPPGAGFGNGVVVRNDGIGYYAWLRSLLIDHDWQFDNEFDDLNASASGVAATRTPDGRRANQWSVGPACVWAVAVVPCHALVSAGVFGQYAADGYSLPYQLAVALTGLLAGLFTLELMYRVGRRFADPVAAAVGGSCVALGSTLVYYATSEPSMAHGLGAAALALFVWFWLRDFGRASARRYLALGLLLGVAALMRWQLAAFGVVLIGEAVWAWRAGREPAGRLCRAAAALAVGGAVGVLPQLVAWRVVYGAWLVEPMPLARRWLSPDLWRVLLSTDRGFFYWTPVALVAAVGLAVAAARRGESVRRVQCGLLLLGVGVQAYALAAISGPGIWLGAAYGYRFLTESCVALAPGLAVLLAARRRVAVLGCALVGWNLLLIGAYRTGVLTDGAAPGELARAASGYATTAVRRHFLVTAASAAGFAAFCATVRRGFARRGAVATPLPPAEPLAEPARRAA